jgi:hypothetical protein
VGRWTDPCFTCHLAADHLGACRIGFWRQVDT